MYYFYIIFSESKNKFYYGVSASLEERLRKHNSNHKGFTGNINDWIIVYSEEFETKGLALEREKQIKNWKSRKRVEAMIKKAKGLEHPD